MAVRNREPVIIHGPSSRGRLAVNYPVHKKITPGGDDAARGVMHQDIRKMLVNVGGTVLLYSNVQRRL